MARMKKFTRGQQEYVDILQQRILNQGGRLGDITKERDKLKEGLEDVVNKSVAKLAEADADRDRAKEMHRTLLNAVEDFLMAEQDKVLKDRQYEGTLGRLGDIHTEQGRETVPVNMMAFNHDEATGRWERSK